MSTIINLQLHVNYFLLICSFMSTIIICNYMLILLINMQMHVNYH